MSGRKKWLTMALLCVMLILGACGFQPVREVSYRVTVVDALGLPYAGKVSVRFLKAGKQAALRSTNDDGIVAIDLPADAYGVELEFAEGAYYYSRDLILSPDKPEGELLVAPILSAEPGTLYVEGVEHEVYPIDLGGTYVPLEPGVRNYFLFSPETAGTYEFSADAGQVGYYGTRHFVQSVNAGEISEQGIRVSVREDSLGGTAGYVLGVDAGDALGCILTVARIGEPRRDLADEPWDVYTAAVAPSPYTLPEGAVLREFDLTRLYELVYNESDGFYHLRSAEGPLVLMLLGEDNQYLDCFKTILDRTGVTRHFFDEDGVFQKKESYTECLLEYISCMDEKTGVYPLTEDLKYILQSEGADSGWFDPENSLYLFRDARGDPIPGIKAAGSWLFMCRYLD